MSTELQKLAQAENWALFQLENRKHSPVGYSPNFSFSPQFQRAQALYRIAVEEEMDRIKQIQHARKIATAPRPPKFRRPHP
jgi:predicted dehydrogenase